MKNLIAKTKVASVTDFGNNNREAKLTAVSSGSDENKSFSQYTPRLDVSILVNNPENIDFFTPGEEVYLSFSKDKPAASDELLELLKNCFIVGYEKFKNLNLFKVITWKLQDAGIKTFLTDVDNKVIDMRFIESQFTGYELELFKTCPINDQVQITFKGVKYYATRLS